MAQQVKVPAAVAADVSPAPELTWRKKATDSSDWSLTSTVVCL